MSRTNHSDPTATDALLHFVADQLVDELRSGDIEPALIHLTERGAADLQLAVLPLDGRHPTDLLLGFTAPPDWHALGIATRGWAYSMAERASEERVRTRVHLVTLLSRTGEFASRVHGIGDDPRADALGTTADDAAGEQIDLLRRALGLPTDAPPCGTDVYWTIEWLSALLGAPPEHLRSFEDAARLHPALRLLHTAPDGPALPERYDDLVDTMRAFVRVVDWSRLRTMVMGGGFDVPELAAGDAGWLDDGALARFVLNRCPPLRMVRAQVGEHLARPVAERVERALDDLGVPRRAWPDDLGDRAA